MVSFMPSFSASTIGSVDVINQIFSYAENGSITKGSITEVSENYYRFERFTDKNETFELYLPHTIQIIENKSYGVQKVEYFENNKKIIAEQNQDVLIVYLSDKNYTTQANTQNYMLIFVLFATIIGIAANILVFRHLKKKHNTITIPSFVLNEEEKKLYDTILENEGKNQKEIGKILNWSKARVSALSNNLVDKNLIRKERFGRVYKLYIINKISENNHK